MAKPQRKRKNNQQEKTKATKPISALSEYFLTIVICSVVALFITTYIVHPMSVPTPSMEPTILVGDRVLVDKFTIRNGFYSRLPLGPVHEIKRHDIVVCKSPIQPDILLVKRVIGLPGETLEIRDKIVYIQGAPLNESYKTHSDEHIYAEGGPNSLIQMDRDNYKAITIPEDNYFVMGDNRNNSTDSRYWGFLKEGEQLDHIKIRVLDIFIPDKREGLGYGGGGQIIPLIWNSILKLGWKALDIVGLKYVDAKTSGKGEYIRVPFLCSIFQALCWDTKVRGAAFFIYWSWNNDKGDSRWVRWDRIGQSIR